LEQEPLEDIMDPSRAFEMAVSSAPKDADASQYSDNFHQELNASLIKSDKKIPSLQGRLWSGKPNVPSKPPKNPKFSLTLSHFVIPEGENSNTHTQSSRQHHENQIYEGL
jgi:hypothetical protein